MSALHCRLREITRNVFPVVGRDLSFVARSSIDGFDLFFFPFPPFFNITVASSSRPRSVLRLLRLDYDKTTRGRATATTTTTTTTTTCLLLLKSALDRAYDRMRPRGGLPPHINVASLHRLLMPGSGVPPPRRRFGWSIGTAAAAATTTAAAATTGCLRRSCYRRLRRCCHSRRPRRRTRGSSSVLCGDRLAIRDDFRGIVFGGMSEG